MLDKSQIKKLKDRSRELDKRRNALIRKANRINKQIDTLTDQMNDIEGQLADHRREVYNARWNALTPEQQERETAKFFKLLDDLSSKPEQE